MGEEDENKRLVLAASCLGFFVAILRATSVNTALPEIRADLGGGVAGLQWVLNGYTLVFAGALLTAGALSDRLRARRVFLAGLALFAGASSLSVLMRYLRKERASARPSLRSTRAWPSVNVEYGTTTPNRCALRFSRSSRALPCEASSGSLSAYSGPVSARTTPLRRGGVPVEILVVVDAHVGDAAAILGRRYIEEPVQPVEILRREVFQMDDLPNLSFGVQAERSTFGVPARRLFAVVETQNLTRPLQGQLPLTDEKQQDAFQGFALDVGSEGLDNLVGQRKLYVHRTILTRYHGREHAGCDLLDLRL